MLRMIVSVYRLKPVELLKSEKTGEKPPKANWIFAVLGLLLLGVAYYLSLTIKDPLVAMIRVYGCRRAGNPCNVSVIYCRLGHIL